MDFYKLKWKMKFRMKKLKGFFTLCKYNYYHKFNLEGDDQFYYYLQRNLLRDLIKTSAEQEYLGEHGLLPEEPEPEEELEPEPEEELEPGLIRKLDFINLMCFAFGVRNKTFCVDELKEFEDRTEIVVKILEDYGEIERTESAVVPHQEGQRYDPVTLEGENFRWDRADGCLRFCPAVQETAEDLAVAKPVRMLQNLVLRVDKAFAEENLSPACLEYACNCSEAGYDWCVVDKSYCTVVYELKLAQTDVDHQKNLLDLQFHCDHYCVSSGLVQK